MTALFEPQAVYRSPVPRSHRLKESRMSRSGSVWTIVRHGPRFPPGLRTHSKSSCRVADSMAAFTKSLNWPPHTCFGRQKYTCFVLQFVVPEKKGDMVLNDCARSAVSASGSP